MSAVKDTSGAVDDALQAIADAAREHGLGVGVAESLTSGALASRLGAGPDASAWFRGGVVAYDESVKFEVLGVTPGPVVTEQCAREMATGAADLLGCAVAAGVTGVGGPEPSEGCPAGTVIIDVVAGGVHDCRTFDFDGDPEDVLDAAVDQTVLLIAAAVLEHLRPS